MLFYDKQYNEARSRFEELYTEEQPITRVSTFMPLIWIYLKFAKTEEATQLLESYVKQNPAATDAKIYLFDLYTDTEKYASALDLERGIYPEAPSLKRLREFAIHYNEFQKTPEHLWALQQLVNLGQASEEEYYQLIYLYAAEGKKQEALNIIKKMIPALKDKKLDSDTLELVVSLLGDNQQKDQAYQFAIQQLKNDPKVAKAVGIAFAMMRHGMKEQSLVVLNALPADLQKDPKVLSARVSLYLKRKDQAQAYALLKEYLKQGIFPRDHAETFIDIALDQNDFASIEQLLAKVPVDNVSEETFLNLIEQAMTKQKYALIKKIKNNLNLSYLNKHAFLAFALNLGTTPPSAEEEQKLLANPTFHATTDYQKAVLANLFNIKKYSKLTQQEIASIQSLESVPLDDLYSLAGFYVNLGQADKGYSLILKLKAIQTHPKITEAWLLLATATGHTEEASKALQSLSNPSDQLLYDLYYAAADNKQGVLATQIANMLVKRNPSLKNKKLLGEALVSTGQDEAAVTIFAELYQSDKSNLDAYLDVLSLAAKKNSKYRPTLKDLVLTRLQTHPLKNKRKAELGYMLIDSDYKQESIPLFLDLAKNKPFKNPNVQTLLGLWGEKPGDQGIEWLYTRAQKAKPEEKLLWMNQLIDVGAPKKALALIDKQQLADKDTREMYLKAIDSIIYTLSKNPKQREELKKWVLAELEVKPLSRKKQRELGFALVNAEYKQEAIPIFLQLSDKKNFKNKDVQTLLSLWGEKPPPAGLKWIKGRALASQGKEKGHWLKHLLDIGDSTDIIAMVNESEFSTDSILDAYLGALTNLKKRQEAGHVIALVLNNETRPKRIRKLAKIAQDEDQLDLALNAYQKLLIYKPNDLGALKELGTIYFGKGNLSLADYYLTLYHFQKPEGDYLTNYYTAEIAFNNQDFETAKRRYVLSINQIRALPKRDLAVRILTAQIFERLEVKDMAVMVFYTLLQQNPNNLSLRADLANLLMDLEYYEEAACVLCFEPPPPKDEAEASERRADEINFDIAHLRLLKETIHPEAGSCLAKQMLENYPDSPLVWEAVASWEFWMGRWRRSLNYYHMAHELNPLNESYLKVRRSILISHEDFYYLEAEYRRTALTQIERFGRVHGNAYLHPSTKFDWEYEADDLSIPAFTNVQGQTLPFSGWIDRFEANLVHYLESGHTLKESFFIADGILGGGFHWLSPNVYGIMGFRAEYHRPCWDFVQTTIQEGTVDRVEFSYRPKLWARWNAYGAATVYRYNLNALTNACSSWSLESIISYTFSPDGYIGRLFGKDGAVIPTYTLDSEYQLRDVEKTAPDGTKFFPIPFASRENHSLFLLVRKKYPWDLSVEGYFGYLYDRIAGGPIVPIYGGNVIMGKLDEFQMRIDYIHSVSTEAGGGTVDKYILNLKYPF